MPRSGPWSTSSISTGGAPSGKIVTS
jgi:hypothetical protein